MRMINVGKTIVLTGYIQPTSDEKAESAIKYSTMKRIAEDCNTVGISVPVDVKRYLEATPYEKDWKRKDFDSTMRNDTVLKEEYDDDYVFVDVDLDKLRNRFPTIKVLRFLFG
jgi:hypothetical protein